MEKLSLNTNFLANDNHYQVKDFRESFKLIYSIRKKYIVAFLLLILTALPGELGEITRGLVTDAYVQVAAFVAITLSIFYFSENKFNFNVGNFLKESSNFQIPIAALLGATPGCGGAVVVVAAYTSGNVSFGAVIATLTATMGDAAFLLIAVRPDIAILVLPLTLIAGIITGYVADNFLSFSHTEKAINIKKEVPMIGKNRKRDILFASLIVPGFGLGVLQLLQYDLEKLFGIFPQLIAIVGMVTSILIWSNSKIKTMTNPKDKPLVRVTEETSFIAIWVLSAYLAYDYLVFLTPLDLNMMFKTIGLLVPLLAIIIGFVPGCGPQILVTTLFINGMIPFSALLGNAISNDGDALFPAIAIAPKAAILATFYSAIPACILAYSLYFFFPLFGQ
tara:strand:- start:241 stop:1416 length:1176 start_codon:yes stop_codon:yes gene_type:complete